MTSCDSMTQSHQSRHLCVNEIWFCFYRCARLAKMMWLAFKTFVTVYFLMMSCFKCKKIESFGAHSFWFAHIFLFLYQTSPDAITLLLGGFALSIGFVISGIPIINLRLRAVLGIIISAIVIYGAIFITHMNYVADPSAQALLYFQADNPNDVYLIGLPFALTLAIIPNLPLLFSSSPLAKT